jgi:hypothetical protein
VLGGGFASNPYLTGVLRRTFCEEDAIADCRADIQLLSSAYVCLQPFLHDSANSNAGVPQLQEDSF